MTTAGGPTAGWLRRVYQEVSRHRHVILYGNVDDRVLLDGDYLDLPDAVRAFLTVLDFGVIGRLDAVDGFRFADDAERERFDRLVWPESAAPADIVDTEEALAALRRALGQPRVPCAFLVEFAELMVGTVASPGEDTGRHLLQLRRAMAEAAVAPTEAGSRRNTLIIAVKGLDTLPDWLHRDNPLVAAVEVTKPDHVERRAFLDGARATFHADRPLDDAEAARAATTLANLTDGMAVRDLEALAATSRLVRIPFDDARRLVTYHRFGLRSDPWEQLDMEKVRNAHKLLSERVIGQDAAVRAVTEMLVNARVGIDFTADADSASTRPRGVFFFVGPTGVGKTELAKAIAEFVFDDEAAICRFDMSEFSEEHAAERLTGAPPGYVGHQHGGVLTNRIMERPFSVLLFDEIEKANPRIFDKFLQIIDDGRLTDGQGRTAYFSHSVVIFTSNLGSGRLHEEMARTGRAEPPPYEHIRELFAGAVADHLAHDLGRPEILGRLGRGIVVFDALRRPVVEQITRKFLDQLARSAAARGLRLEFDHDGISAAVSERLAADGASLGARRIRDPILEELVRAPLTAWIAQHAPPPGTRIRIRRAPGGDCVVEEPPA